MELLKRILSKMGKKVPSKAFVTDSNTLQSTSLGPVKKRITGLSTKAKVGLGAAGVAAGAGAAEAAREDDDPMSQMKRAFNKGAKKVRSWME